jgi:hypothetical protein
MSTTRSSQVQKSITIRVSLSQDKIIIHSGGSTYEIPTPFSKSKPVVYVLPRAIKEIYGSWNPDVKSYVVLVRGNVIHVPDTVVPSSLSLVIKYSGESVKKFYDLLTYTLKKYYRGESILKLPMSDKYVYKFAIMLSRMSELQPIDDV